MKNQEKAENKPIGFGQAISNFWTGYVNFRGRATRREYWYCWLFMVLVNILFSLTGFVISTVVGVVLLIPRWALSVRRFHDVGLSGWMYMVPAVAILIWFMLRESWWVRMAMLGYLTADCIAFIGVLFVVYLFNFVVFCLPTKQK